jgi:hypothetical protein
LDACIRQLTASPREQIIRTCAFVIVNIVGVGVVVVVVGVVVGVGVVVVLVLVQGRGGGVTIVNAA